MTALLAYLELEVRRTLRDHGYLFFILGLPLLFYLAYTTVLVQDESTIGGNQWAVHFLVSMAAFGGIMTALSSGGGRLASERASGWIRQLRTTPLPPLSYLIARLVISVVTVLPAIVLVALAGVLVNNVRLPLGAWLALVLLLSVGTLPLVALGVFLGYVLNEHLFSIVSTLFGLIFAFLGGLWTPLPNFPAALQTLGRTLPSYHYAALGWDAAAGGVPDATSVAVLAGYLLVFGALAVWRYLREQRTPIG